jgi:hypothetical protein
MTNDGNVIDFMSYLKRADTPEPSNDSTVCEVIDICSVIQEKKAVREKEKIAKLYDDITDIVSFISGKTDNGIAIRRFDEIKKKAEGLSNQEKIAFFDEQYDVLSDDMEMMFQEETYRITGIKAGLSAFFTLAKFEDEGLEMGVINIKAFSNLIDSVNDSILSFEYRLQRGEVDSARYSALLVRVEKLPGIIKDRLEDVKSGSGVLRLKSIIRNAYSEFKNYHNECNINFGMGFNQLSAVMNCLEAATDNIRYGLERGMFNEKEYKTFICKVEELPEKVKVNRNRYESTLGSYYALS